MPMQTSNTQASNEGTLVDVEFGLGPLGVVINYSNRGTIIVTEFSNDNNMMGQAQASGKVQVGDEVYAVNGQRLDVIGMEGFKRAVGASKRPLRVTFRRLSRGAASHVPVHNTASNMAFPVGGAPLAQVSSALNQQVQQPNAFPPVPAMNNNGAFPMRNVNAGGNFQNSASGQFPGMGDGMNMFPFPAPASQPMGDPSTKFNPPMPTNLPGFMGDMSGQSFPAPPMGGQNFNTLPNVYNVAAGPGAQSAGAWQGAANPMLQPFPPVPAQNGMNMNGGGNVIDRKSVV